jgi:eukaryotic-like serine/threonine-protein kinase
MEPGTRQQASTDDLSGRTLGDFRLLRRLGQGGMGQVYLAEQISLKRKVAIKIMRPDMAINATAFQRFRSEAEAIARVSHANIVAVYAFAEEAGLHYIALEYVDGCTVKEYLDRKGKFDVSLAVNVIRQVAAALQRASELGIIHRDIKPENILLTRRGEVKVADFGLSRCFTDDGASSNLTQPGVTMGTPLYMSPEQVEGRAVDPRTDIYSLGVTCYHMLAGEPPFSGPTAIDIALQHLEAQPTPLGEKRPDLPADLCAIVHKMMAKALDDRYSTCKELLHDLSRMRASLSGTSTEAGIHATLPEAASLSTGGRIKRRVATRWLLVASAAGSILVAFVAGGALARSRHARAHSSATLGDVEPSEADEQHQEAFLREAVARYADPGKDPAQLDLGLRHSLELGLFYLQHGRFADADKFFQGLIDNPHQVAAYRTLGQLGHAIVLGLEDQATESNRLLLQLLHEQAREGRSPDRLGFLLNQAPLRFQIARALQANRANLHEAALPPELEHLRTPPHLSK